MTDTTNINAGQNTERRRCATCHHTLADDTPQTCPTCVNRARHHLTDILTTWRALPALAASRAYGQPAAPRNGPRTTGTPIPGGDALALLTDAWETRDHSCDQPGELTLMPVLGAWEDDWREHFGDDPGPWPPRLEHTLGYLEAHTGRAAQRHPAWPDYWADLHRTHRRLLTLAGADLRPVRVATCPGCGGNVARQWTDHGLDDHATCLDCRTRYTTPQLRLALLAQASEAPGWVRMTVAADVTGVHLRTIQTWTRRGVIPHTTTGPHRLVRLADVTTARRTRLD